MFSVDVACPVTFPADGELKVIVHCPFASVFAPAVVHEPVGAECTAPFASVNVTSTCSPAAGTKVPEHVFFISVTVNVCDIPTSFVAEGAIAIVAPTCAGGCTIDAPPAEAIWFDVEQDSIPGAVHVLCHVSD